VSSIAGPAGLTAVVLLMVQAAGDPVGSAIVLAAMLLCLLLTYFGMIFTDVLHRVLKATGSNVLARLAGVILATLAVQFIFDGIRGARLVAGGGKTHIPKVARPSKAAAARGIPAVSSAWARVL